MIITIEKPRHSADVEALLDLSFGSDRFRKTAYRLRDGVPPLADLSYVAVEERAGGRETVLATIRYWPVLIGGASSLLLGPIAVAPEHQSQGLGAKLIRISLNKAFSLGYGSVILVGDAPYYTRFGFTRDLTLSMYLPGPVDPARFLGLELVDGALAGVGGVVTQVEVPVAVPEASVIEPVESARRRRRLA